MKKLILGLLFAYSSLLAEMNWTNYDEAFKQAKSENKIVMVMISRTSCGVCRYMKREVFTEKEVIEKFNAKFIGVEIELDMDDVPQELEYIGTPTFHFLDANKKKLLMINGGKRTKGFLETLDSIN